MFVLCSYEPTNCCTFVAKNEFYLGLFGSLPSVGSTDAVAAVGEFEASFLPTGICVPSDRTASGDRIIWLCSGHRLFLAIFNFCYNK